MAIGALYGGLSVTFRFCREVAGEGKVSERGEKVAQIYRAVPALQATIVQGQWPTALARSVSVRSAHSELSTLRPQHLHYGRGAHGFSPI